MIQTCQFIAAACWLAFCVIWLIAAAGVKKNIVRRPWWLRLPVRLALALLLVGVFLRYPDTGLIAYGLADFTGSGVIAAAGLVLVATGIGIAIWARILLGRNWGMPMTLKQDHQLVTAGPYRLVRHPIYSGIILAMLGSVLVLGLWWLAILAVNFVQFVYAARKEEQLMMRVFPDAYAEYRERSWMLVPYVI